MNDVSGAERRPKHLELNESIEMLYDLKNATVSLLERIKGENNPKCEEAPKQSNPSLQEVLNGAPDRINNHCTEIKKMLDPVLLFFSKLLQIMKGRLDILKLRKYNKI